MRSRTLPIMLTLAAACIAEPAAAQDARACSNEVQRLSQNFPAAAGGSTQAPAVTAGQPGARVDAGTDENQQRQIRDLLQQADTAGKQGDGTGCMQRLTQARTMLRESGVGAPLPGSGTGRGATDLQRGTTDVPRGTADVPRGTTNVPPGTTDTGKFTTTPDGMANPQGAETPRIVPPPSRNTRDSAVSPGGTGNSTSRGTTSGPGGAGTGGAGGSSGGGGGGGR